MKGRVSSRVVAALLAVTAAFGACVHDEMLAAEANKAEELHRQLRSTHRPPEGAVLAAPGTLAPFQGNTRAALGSSGEASAPQLRSSAQHGGRSLLQGEWAPVRIKPLYQGLTESGLTADEATVVAEYAVPRAVTRLSAMLRVKQLSSPLQLSPFCTSIWQGTTKCAEQPISPSCGFFSADRVASIPSSIVGPGTYYPNGPDGAAQTVPAGGPGLERTDYVVFVLAGSSEAQGCASSTQAFASSCQRDSAGRPIAGTIVMCKSFLRKAGLALNALAGTSTLTVAGSERAAIFEFTLSQIVDVAVHELIHALGFSGDSWPRFVSSTGQPLTPRDSTDPSKPANSRVMTCGGQQATLYYSSASTVSYPAERGSLQCDPETLTDLSQCTHRLILPNTQLATRTMFGCNDLPGAELENQPTTECALAASHLEQRVFPDSMMSAFSTHQSTISAPTLAIMHDSGWWKPNYYAAGDVTPGRDYGVHTGCAFARDSKCLNPGNPPTIGATSVTRTQGGASQGSIRPVNHYCASQNDFMCTTDRRAIGKCNILEYNGALPSRFTYFSNENTAGGLKEADFCPLPSHYSNRVCDDPTNNWANGDPSSSKSTQREAFGNVYGASSACVEASSFIKNGWSSSSPPAAGCFRVTCEDRSTNTLRISVDSDSASGASTVPTSELVSTTCNSAGAIVTMSGYSGSLVCPDPAMFCHAGGPVVPAQPGKIGFGDSFVQILWPENGNPSMSGRGLGFTVARALYEAGSSASSILQAAAVQVQLRAATSSELALSGLTDAQAGVVGTHLGFGSNAASSTTISWGTGEAGHKDVSSSFKVAAWSTAVGASEPAPRVFIATVASANGTASIVDGDSSSAVVVLTTKAPQTYIPTTSSGAAGALLSSMAVVMAMAALAASVGTSRR